MISITTSIEREATSLSAIFGEKAWRSSFWISPASARDHRGISFAATTSIAACIVMLWHAHMTPWFTPPAVSLNGRGVLLSRCFGCRKELPAVRPARARRGWTFITDDGVSLYSSVQKSDGSRHSPGNRGSAQPRSKSYRNSKGIWRRSHTWASSSFNLQPGNSRTFGGKFPHSWSARGLFEPSRRGPATLVPMSSEDAFTRLDRDLPMMEQIEDQRASLRRLVEARSYELRYTDLYDAANVLESLVL